MKLAVIADDLTGANDTGVQFAKQGLNTTVLFSDTKLKEAHVQDDVIVLNSDSRALEAEEAYRIVHEQASRLQDLHIEDIFKKIDSTMRGNIGAEIDAVMDVFNYKISFVVPAFPNSKRTTINGNHYIDEVPLAETEFANDPASPVKESYLPDLLQKQSKRKVELLSISDVRKGSDHIAKKVNELLSDKLSKVILIDGTSDEELKMIVEAAQSIHESILWVGSAGIAYHLAGEGQTSEPLQSTQVNERDPVLVVAGSLNSITGRQIEDMKKNHRVQEVVISPERFFDEKKREKEMDRVVEAGLALLEKGDLVLSTNRTKEAVQRVKELQQEFGLSSFELGHLIAESMAIIAGRLIEQSNTCGAVLTGGDIAGTTCQVLKGEGIRVTGEVETGIPYGHLVGNKYDCFPVVTKAGAFGTEQALSKSLQAIVALHHSQTNDPT